MRVKIDASEVLTNLTKFEGLMGVVAKEAVSASMAEAEVDAKTSAPWTDRTGNARNSITGTQAVKKGSKYIGNLFIGVFYGVYLELKNHGKYRVVWPTIEREATRVPLWIKHAYDRHIGSNL